MLVETTVGRTIPGPADDTNGHQNRGTTHLDSPKPLQKDETLSGQLGVSGRKTGNKGEGSHYGLPSQSETLYDKGNHTQYPHGFSVNSCWQFMNTTTHLNNKTNCYVCAHMPLSAHTSGLWPHNITELQTACLLAIARHPGLYTHWTGADFSKPLNLTGVFASPIANMDCALKTELLAWPQMSDPLPDIILLNRLSSGQLAICMMGNGSVLVGELPQHLCKHIYSFCPSQNESTYYICRGNTTSQ